MMGGRKWGREGYREDPGGKGDVGRGRDIGKGRGMERGRDIGGQRDIGRGIFEKEVLKSSVFEKLRPLCDFNKFLLRTHKSPTKESVVNDEESQKYKICLTETRF